MRAVLDPNVLVSAVLSRAGTSAILLRAWRGGDYELVVSPALLRELERVLAYPKIAKRVDVDQARELLGVFAREADLIDDPEVAPPVHSPDPDDDYLISLAQAARAVLVSGDGDLHGLAGQLPVYTPASFLTLLNDR